ncbi:CRISPR system precrRNA processing endoribonuclease RAMP protein Cas6 [Fusobacterium polymorphum]|uniref:CRISPR system precrRNA processing endoribonuclease RAMP protein Cas6 n=1 Tax=Fusobacterium nucleatum subsp. polymorphum TaxID=76857 RepID=UPI002B4BBE28|nr:CRISPR system precrRNA processing endoribonuclease RAMP protein Cas6 [Fusobacterium polymorphum]WRL74470.1 CRISPR system precrRNA processing endoribonuclease RAMP protein Cas6 [Fusobacterium polymorphum]
MKTILIKTQKRKNNISKEYLQVDIQKRLFPNELSNKILLIHIDLENIELLINDEDLNFLVNKILEYKLNDNLYINHEKIIIKEIKMLDDIKNNYENKEKFKIINNRVSIIFKSPTIFKVGYNFLDFSFQLLFLLSCQKYNKFFKNKKIILNKEELEKIDLISENIEKGELNSFIGEIELDFSKISDKEKDKYTTLLNFMKLNGVGYKYKKYYGVIELI